MISRASAFVGRSSGQAKPEYTVVLTLMAVSCLSLFAELGGHATAVVPQMAGLLP